MTNKLINKLGIGVLAGALALGGCKNNLSKYNEENQKVYGDFAKFCIENPNKIVEIGSVNNMAIRDSGYQIGFIERNSEIYNLNVYDVSTGDDFFDDNLKGLDDGMGSGDGIASGSKAIRYTFIKHMPIKEQMSTANRYTNTLKKIMHKNKYGGY